MKLPRVFPAAGLLLFGLAGNALAQKTDVIVLFNGDRVTGEIKSYSEGRLVLSTDIASDVSVKWNKIVSITSSKRFEIETVDGIYHYGSLAPSTPPGKLAIISGTGVETFGFFDIVHLSPIYENFWRRIDGSLDLGFTYTQANNYFQFSLNADAHVRRPAFVTYTSLSAFLSSQQGVTSSQRANFAYTYQKLLKDRWSLVGGVGVDRNLDLGLNLRGSLTGGVARDLVQTNRTLFTVLLGLSGSREKPVSGETTSDAAVYAGARFSTFTYDFPKLTITANLGVLPYLTDSGRVRLEFQSSVKREIIRDFYLSLSLFDSFDSRDPTTFQAKNDWGPVLSIGWTF